MDTFSWDGYACTGWERTFVRQGLVELSQQTQTLHVFFRLLIFKNRFLTKVCPALNKLLYWSLFLPETGNDSYFIPEMSTS